MSPSDQDETPSPAADTAPAETPHDSAPPEPAAGVLVPDPPTVCVVDGTTFTGNRCPTCGTQLKDT